MIQAGTLDLEQVDFDLHALMEEIARRFADRAHGKAWNSSATSIRPFRKQPPEPSYGSGK